MKITVKELKRIIRESLEEAVTDPTSDATEDTSVVLKVKDFLKNL